MYAEQWWERGHCRTADPRIFDGKPRITGRPVTGKLDRRWDEAREVCAPCPVKAECLEFVLSAEEWNPDASFAAGYEPDQLAYIRRNRRRR